MNIIVDLTYTPGHYMVVIPRFDRFAVVSDVYGTVLLCIAVGGAVWFDTPSSHTHGGWRLVFGG